MMKWYEQAEREEWEDEDSHDIMMMKIIIFFIVVLLWWWYKQAKVVVNLFIFLRDLANGNCEGGNNPLQMRCIKAEKRLWYIKKFILIHSLCNLCKNVGRNRGRIFMYVSRAWLYGSMNVNVQRNYFYGRPISLWWEMLLVERLILACLNEGVSKGSDVIRFSSFSAESAEEGLKFPAHSPIIYRNIKQDQHVLILSPFPLLPHFILTTLACMRVSLYVHKNSLVILPPYPYVQCSHHQHASNATLNPSYNEVFIHQTHIKHSFHWLTRFVAKTLFSFSSFIFAPISTHFCWWRLWYDLLSCLFRLMEKEKENEEVMKEK